MSQSLESILANLESIRIAKVNAMASAQEEVDAALANLANVEESYDTAIANGEAAAVEALGNEFPGGTVVERNVDNRQGIVVSTADYLNLWVGIPNPPNEPTFELWSYFDVTKVLV